MEVELPPIIVQRLLVTGGREFSDGDYVFRWLTILHHKYGFQLLIHGGARGVDSLADVWARGAGVHPCQCDALWPYYRARGMWKAAGHARNAAMALLKPHLVVAFPGGRGTADMWEIATQRGFPRINLAEDYKRETAE